MIEHQDIDSCGDCTPRFSFTKSTLPAKIIHLRKVSQENHIRRMKLAYQKKEMKGLMDISTCLSPSFPKKSSSKSKTSPLIPTGFQSCTGPIQCRQMFELLPARAKSDENDAAHPNSSKHNFKKKSTDLKIIKNRFSDNNNKPSCNFSRGDVCDLNSLKKNKPVIESNDCLHTKLDNKMKTHYSKKKAISLSCKNKDENVKDDELLSKKSVMIVKEQKNTGEEKNNKIIIAKKKPSKIPILKSRLNIRGTSKENKRHGVENSIEIVNESFETMLKDVQNQIKELSRQQAIPHEENDINIEESYELPKLIHNCYEDDPYKKIYHTFCDEEESRNEIPSVDKWMISILDTADSRKNPSECSLLLKFKDMTTTLPCRDKKSLLALRKESTPELADIHKGSGISDKYDYITDITESDNSSESYFEIGETIDERKTPRVQNINLWKDTNFDAASTITVPSDKDLELADHRDPIYRNLPDYPNTPYNLRYPRYKFKGCNNTLSSIQIDTPENSNRAKSLKNRKKNYSATPKRWKSGAKKRKSRKQILRKKES